MPSESVTSTRQKCGCRVQDGRCRTDAGRTERNGAKRIAADARIYKAGRPAPDDTRLTRLRPDRAAIYRAAAVERTAVSVFES